MFANSLFESNALPAPRRGWTTLASFAIQTIALMAVVAVPVLVPEALRLQARVPHPPTIFTPIIPERVHVEQQAAGTSATIVLGPANPNVLTQPPRIPPRVLPIVDVGPPAAPMCMTNCGSLATNSNLLSSINTGQAGRVAVEPAKPLRVSILQVGTPINRVQPRYPHIAVLARKEGDVVLSAVISKDGTIESLQVRSGPAILVPSAIEAVKQWRYRPYMLNGERVEVETEITVRFRLNQ